MNRRHHKLALSGMLMLGLSAGFTNVYAAKPLDLVHQNVSVLQSFVTSPTASALKSTKANMPGIVETKRSVGVNNMLHVRIQQTYSGYPVFGADAVVHIPHGTNTAKSMNAVLAAAKNNNGSMNGKFYQDLHADLNNAPAYIFEQAQAQKTLHEMIGVVQGQTGIKADVQNAESKLMVYVDKDTHKAHWIYKVSFVTAGGSKRTGPIMPVFLVDATTSEVYRAWDNLQSADREDVAGGGFGGNEKQKYIYDGISSDKLDIQRDASNSTCYLENKDVIVKQCSFTIPLLYRCVWSSNASQACKAPDAQHNNTYWNGDADKVNGGFSPSNDALYNSKIVKDLYKTWYSTEVLTGEDGTPLKMTMVVHLDMENAYWDPMSSTMNFGDGGDIFYPLTSLGVTAHEVSHGFTTQHSNLTYQQQSGGLNESYSDMAAQAAEVFAKRQNTWQIGPEIVKGSGALRYMDEPGKDCAGKQGIPGEHCSISKTSEYNAYVEKHKNDAPPKSPFYPDTRYPNVHYSSGVFNKAFVLLSKAWGADHIDQGVKKAFQVMLAANANYWTSESDYADAACGLIKATTEAGYSTDAVKAALDAVEVKSAC